MWLSNRIEHVDDNRPLFGCASFVSAYFYEETLEPEVSRSARLWTLECQRQAVLIMVSRDEWEGSHCSNPRASSGLATSTGGSPGRRGAVRVGTDRPPTRRTLAITSSTDAP